MDDYDVILLGYPTWWDTLPPPVMTFLTQYDFRGKEVYSFSSHGGTIFGESVSDLQKRLPGVYVGLLAEYYYSGDGDLGNMLRQWLTAAGLDSLILNLTAR